MSTSATVLAIGRFTPAIIDQLEYPAEKYANYREGQPIVSEFGASAMLSISTVAAIAEAIGVDANDPATWLIRQDRIDYRAIGRVAGVSNEALDELRDGLRAFGDAGFKMFLRVDS